MDKDGARKSAYFLHKDALDTVQFYNARQMPILKIAIGGRSLSLGLDTGAGINLLDEALLPHLESHFIHHGSSDLAGISGEYYKLKKVKIRSAQVGKLYCEPMKTLFTPLSQFQKIAKEQNMHLDGILGYEFLQQFRVAINFPKKEIYLWDKAKLEEQLAMRKELEEEAGKSKRN